MISLASLLGPRISSKQTEFRVSIVVSRYVSFRSRAKHGVLVLHTLSSPSCVFGGNLQHRANFRRCQVVLMSYCVGGQFVLEGFCPSWRFDWRAYGPVSSVRGFLQGLLAYNPEIYTQVIVLNICYCFNFNEF